MQEQNQPIPAARSRGLVWRIKQISSKFSWLEWGMMTAIVGLGLYFFLTSSDEWWYRALDLVVAICGVISVVLCAKGKISNYYFALINVAGYAILAYHNAYYGELMLNAFYYLPVNVIGLVFWRRHRAKQNASVVEAKKLSKRNFALIALGCALAITGYAFWLSTLGNAAPYLDSTTNVLSIVAMILMITRYREQWVLWIVVDIVTVIMWILAGDLTMIAMWSIFLINAVHGWLVWGRLARGEAQNGK
jgi:nicotinamide mononucleotide transporter